jgi:hypothetical protein
MAKPENTFRAVNIGMVNELAPMRHRMGIDVWEVIEAAATKPSGSCPSIRRVSGLHRHSPLVEGEGARLEAVHRAGGRSPVDALFVIKGGGP